MRPPYSEYAAPPIYVYPEPPRRGVQFSRTELIQLGVAILGLSAAFTVVLVNPLLGGGLDLFPGNFAANLGFGFVAALVSVGSGVGLHEIMHKIVAERYGHWAEFRYSLQGLAMAFVFAFLGFIFGAPGATYISGAVTPQQNSRISAAGPVTNIGLGIVFFAALVAIVPMAYPGSLAFLLAYLFQIVASVNLILAAFNMIPLMPLDGAKVWHWNKLTWLAILAVALGILGFGASQQYLFL
ncbi:MAG TPA: hypothetical protein VEY12_09600 [Thermoplasmata archaeon]|nr:hypothetical protein [Thermoplasmata archaeon]